MTKKVNIITYCCLLLIIIILSSILIFRKSEVIVTPNNEQIYKDSIILLQNLNQQSHIRQEKLQRAYDSLSSIEPIIIHKTRDKIEYIYTGASINDLDSIIRSTWKNKSRYR